jgi:hypothetical protein
LQLRDCKICHINRVPSVIGKMSLIKCYDHCNIGKLSH